MSRLSLNDGGSRGSLADADLVNTMFMRHVAPLAINRSVGTPEDLEALRQDVLYHSYKNTYVKEEKAPGRANNITPFAFAPPRPATTTTTKTHTRARTHTHNRSPGIRFMANCTVAIIYLVTMGASTTPWWVWWV